MVQAVGEFYTPLVLTEYTVQAKLVGSQFPCVELHDDAFEVCGSIAAVAIKAPVYQWRPETQLEASFLTLSSVIPEALKP